MSTRVYVGGLSNDMRNDDLLSIFRRYYPIRVDLKQGYGFIEFGDVRDAEDAIHDLDGYKIDGRRLNVQPAKGVPRTREDFQNAAGYRGGGGGGEGGGYYSRSSPVSSSSLPRKPMGYRLDVEGLDSRTSWQDLKDFARAAGNVTYANVTVENGKVSTQQNTDKQIQITTETHTRDK